MTPDLACPLRNPNSMSCLREVQTISKSPDILPLPSLRRLPTGGVLNPLKNTTNTSHNKHLHQDPLQPPPEPIGTAGSRTFIDSLRSDYDFRARNAAENRERQQAEEKRREEQKKEQQKWNRGVNILIYAIIVIAIGSKLWVWIRKERELEQGVSPTECEDVTPPVDTVRRDALRAAAEARRRLSEAEEQVRAAEEDWNFARAQFGSAAAEEYGRRLEAAKAAIARGFDTYKQIEHTPDSHAKRRLATTITEALDEDPLRASAAASKAATLINRALAAPGRR